MTLWRCIAREILHRKLNFALALLSAAVAVGCVVGTVEALRLFDHQTDSILAAGQEEVEERGRLLNDDVRKITKGLGFNILVLPEGQDLADVYAEGYASRTMPEEYVYRLAEAPIDSIDHLLPALERKLVWPERERTIIVVGIRGEVPRLRGEGKKPLLDPVLPGQIVLGYELHRQAQLAPGDEVTLLGAAFEVAACYPQRGSKDDITAWIDLGQAQELLGEPERINAIWALECNCNSIERLAEIRTDIMRVLPDTQVIEVATQATARAEARKKAEALAVASLAAAREERAALRERIAGLAAWTAPLALLTCGAWIGLLALANVRQRRTEIGILRAMGWRSSQILRIFLGKAALAGVLGAALGTALAIAAAARFTDAGSSGIGWQTSVAALLAAPILAMAASWLPALAAASRDPARVLAQE